MSRKRKLAREFIEFVNSMGIDVKTAIFDDMVYASFEEGILAFSLEMNNYDVYSYADDSIELNIRNLFYALHYLFNGKGRAHLEVEND